MTQKQDRITQEQLDAAIATWNRAIAEGAKSAGGIYAPIVGDVTVAPAPEAPPELFCSQHGDDVLLRGYVRRSPDDVHYIRADLSKELANHRAQPFDSGYVERMLSECRNGGFTCLDSQKVRNYIATHPVTAPSPSADVGLDNDPKRDNALTASLNRDNIALPGDAK
jgi:hypothetical protein